MPESDISFRSLRKATDMDCPRRSVVNRHFSLERHSFVVHRVAHKFLAIEESPGGKILVSYFLE